MSFILYNRAVNSPRVSDCVDALQAEGRYAFDRRELEKKLSLSPAALTKALNRLTRKRRVRKIRKGFHIIIPVEFSSRGMIPPDWFIDDLMRHLGCAYYIGLQSAAAYHGASHQQVQEFQVVTARQVLPIKLPELTIRFFRKIHFFTTKTQTVKGHGGMLPVSTPEATALDVVRYANRIGGADAVLTLLEELVESMDPARLRETTAPMKERATLQRLGWFLDHLGAMDLSDSLYAVLESEGPPSRTRLDPGAAWEGASSNNRWRVVENTQPESDL